MSTKRSPPESKFEESVILTDLEGTVTSINYVKNVLFKYIRNSLKSYVDENWNGEEFKEDLALIRKQTETYEKEEKEGIISIPEGNGDDAKEAFIKNVLWQMDEDFKNKALKQFQGHVMRAGYEQEKLKGHIYPDVVEALQSWSESKRMCVFSSGSVEAQKLLLKYSEQSDLLKYFSEFFDTEVGSKFDPSSYSNIVCKLGVEASDVMFLTDVPKEAEAAKKAGLTPVLVVREGNVPLSEEDAIKFPVIKSFDELILESSKRKKLSTSESPLKPGNGLNSNVPEDKTDKIGNSLNCDDVEMTDVSKTNDSTVDVKSNTEDSSKVKSDLSENSACVIENSVEDKKVEDQEKNANDKIEKEVEENISKSDDIVLESGKTEKSGDKNEDIATEVVEKPQVVGDAEAEQVIDGIESKSEVSDKTEGSSEKKQEEVKKTDVEIQNQIDSSETEPKKLTNMVENEEKEMQSSTSINSEKMEVDSEKEVKPAEPEKIPVEDNKKESESGETKEDMKMETEAESRSKDEVPVLENGENKTEVTLKETDDGQNVVNSIKSSEEDENKSEKEKQVSKDKEVVTGTLDSVSQSKEPSVNDKCDNANEVSENETKDQTKDRNCDIIKKPETPEKESVNEEVSDKTVEESTHESCDKKNEPNSIHEAENATVNDTNCDKVNEINSLGEAEKIITNDSKCDKNNDVNGVEQGLTLNGVKNEEASAQEAVLENNKKTEVETEKTETTKSECVKSSEPEASVDSEVKTEEIPENGTHNGANNHDTENGDVNGKVEKDSTSASPVKKTQLPESSQETVDSQV